MKSGEYFLLEYTGNEYPMLEFSSDDQDDFELFKTEPVEQKEPFEFRFAKPVPRNPQMGDYHYFEYVVFSNRIKEVLQKLNIPKIEYLDAEISDKKGNIHDEYCILHICNRISCMDKDKSIWTPTLIDKNKPREIKKLVLDTICIETISLQERLIFALKEHSSYYLFHESVVDAITAINPKGLRFVNVESWHSNISWELNN
jgi:hypothetical protein